MTMSLGLSNYIIDLSPYYRFNFFNLLVTAVLNIGLNYMLIPKYGILGAAYATGTAFLLMNFTGSSSPQSGKMHPLPGKPIRRWVGLGGVFFQFPVPKRPGLWRTSP
ncbi:MAG: polysaccharide biosynthesis C-terminal domain-containing protein [Haliscomenobacter sp.]|nr:polysaccharide biosynthesis C-terminal domain-containing protein [Haliscomenobacter sp.]